MSERIVYPRQDGKWAWRLEANNGQIIATDGSQGYENEADARKMADRIIGGDFRYADKMVIRPTQANIGLAEALSHRLFSGL